MGISSKYCTILNNFGIYKLSIVKIEEENSEMQFSKIDFVFFCKSFQPPHFLPIQFNKMDNKAHDMAQRETETHSSFKQFLWWLSTAEKDLIKDCKIDSNRYAITGMAVLGTWLFATLAWSYFFYTVVQSLPLAAALGIFMGLLILGIDRALIKGITASNKKKAAPFLFRMALALTIGTFMAQPALLYLFDKEIHVQISLDNEQRKMQKKLELDSLYFSQTTLLQQEKSQIANTLQKKYDEVAAQRLAYIQETDGSGGSGKRGYETIARAKEQEYLKTDEAYEALKASFNPRIHAIDSSLSNIDAIKSKGLSDFNTLMNDGFLTRIEALHHLIDKNDAAKFRYYLLVIILVLIELMPVIAKSLLPDGSYEERIQQQEWLEKDMILFNTKKEKELKEIYNQAAFDQDKEFIKIFYEEARAERLEKMRQRLQKWKENNHEAFDDVWGALKKDMLSKQEN